MLPEDKVFIAGHTGMVGRAICRILEGRVQLLKRGRREGLDLCDRKAVREFFHQERPKFVIDAAAKVGGIAANNNQPVEFFLQNVTIQNNLIEASADFGVEKFLFLGSSCIYPKYASQPISEDALLTGPLEPTNEAYAIAKISGVRLCQYYAREYGKNFISVMPTNLYGPFDNFDLETSHVLPALMRKFHEAKKSGLSQVVVWGSGTPRREFLHVDDLALACVYLMEKYDSPEIVNVGCGEDLTIAEVAEMMRRVVGFEGEVIFDRSKPDGTPRKVLDVTRIRSLGWQPSIPLEEGLRRTYAWYLENVELAGRVQ